MAFSTLKDLGVKNNPYSKEKYDNYINGKWVKPVDGQYFENITPLSGQPFCEVARSNEKDINLALDYAKVSERVIAHSTAKPVELLETLVEQLADIILTEFNTTQVKIRVSKPAAVAQAQTVGVEITRNKASV